MHIITPELCNFPLQDFESCYDNTVLLLFNFNIILYTEPLSPGFVPSLLFVHHATYSII